MVRRALLALLSAAGAHASGLWAISGDPNNSFVPDILSMVDSVAQTVTPVATLGNGSLGFNGGLTAGPGGTLYGIANDSSGAGSLYAIQPDGTLSLIGSAGGLGAGFLGGLAWDSSNSTFYAAVNDALGTTTLYSIDASGHATPLGLSVGTGFSGLTYDIATGLFWGVSNDSSGNSSFCYFDLIGNENCQAFGTGFGAISYDPASQNFFVLSPVNNVATQLYPFSFAGGLGSPLFTLGDGFVELAVATPEPATGVLGGLGVVAIGIVIRRRGRGRSFEKQEEMK